MTGSTTPCLTARASRYARRSSARALSVDGFDEQQPQQSRALIGRALASVVLPMDDYAPDGAYPEGYGYWDYGTSFNVMLLGALEKLYGTDFGLSARPGFLRTGGYMANMAGPTGGLELCRRRSGRRISSGHVLRTLARVRFTESRDVDGRVRDTRAGQHAAHTPGCPYAGARCDRAALAKAV